MNKNIIVIGASAGGITVVNKIVSNLPRDFPASIFIVIHTAANSPGMFDSILEHVGKIPAKYVNKQEEIIPNQIYLPLPDHHLVFGNNTTICVTRGLKENRFRPAIDPLFRSAAQMFGSQVIGIILTGVSMMVLLVSRL